MALKMITLNEIDKKFIDDNMLTDEDFQFGEQSFKINEKSDLEMAFEESGLLKYICNQPSEVDNFVLDSANKNSNGTFDDIDDTLVDFLKEFGCDVKIKIEPSSYSSDSSQNDKMEINAPEEFYSSNTDIPIITIPESSTTNGQTSFFSDTPPTTPPSMTDTSPESPDSIVIPISSVSNLPYILSHTDSNLKTLNSKAQIQSNTTSTTLTNNVPFQKLVLTNNNTKPFVLNPEQAAKLANGTLKIRAPPINMPAPISFNLKNKKMSKCISTPPPVLPLTNDVQRNVGLRGNSINMAALKRQQRMIKNRESACLSRKKKKEYMQKLEEEVSQISAENLRLKEENSNLKLKITDLENEILKLKTSFSNKTMKKTACLMIVLFMLTFNLAPYSQMFEIQNQKHLKQESSTYVGRNLLWKMENETQGINLSKPFFQNMQMLDKNQMPDSYMVEWDNIYNTSTCLNFINKTESLRLESDLLGWVQRVEKKRKQKESKFKQHIIDMMHALPPLPKHHSLSKYRNELQKDIWAKRKNRNEILIYHTPRKAYEDFFDAIHRRDDTFYFISFSGDHLLLPAIAHNHTLRPRMSLVMPAMTFNDTFGETDEHVSMMQIDCEVMDTKLVYIKESVIPSHLRPKQSNSTEKSHTKKHSIHHKPKRLQASKAQLLEKT